jgi:hypothetical protein
VPRKYLRAISRSLFEYQIKEAQAIDAYSNAGDKATKAAARPCERSDAMGCGNGEMGAAGMARR